MITPARERQWKKDMQQVVVSYLDELFRRTISYAVFRVWVPSAFRFLALSNPSIDTRWTLMRRHKCSVRFHRVAAQAPQNRLLRRQVVTQCWSPSSKAPDSKNNRFRFISIYKPVYKKNDNLQCLAGIHGQSDRPKTQLISERRFCQGAESSLWSGDLHPRFTRPYRFACRSLPITNPDNLLVRQTCLHIERTVAYVIRIRRETAVDESFYLLPFSKDVYTDHKRLHDKVHFPQCTNCLQPQPCHVDVDLRHLKLRGKTVPETQHRELSF